MRLSVGDVACGSESHPSRFGCDDCQQGFSVEVSADERRAQWQLPDCREGSSQAIATHMMRVLYGRCSRRTGTQIMGPARDRASASVRERRCPGADLAKRTAGWNRR